MSVFLLKFQRAASVRRSYLRRSAEPSPAAGSTAPLCGGSTYRPGVLPGSQCTSAVPARIKVPRFVPFIRASRGRVRSLRARLLASLWRTRAEVSGRCAPRRSASADFHGPNHFGVRAWQRPSKLSPGELEPWFLPSNGAPEASSCAKVSGRATTSHAQQRRLSPFVQFTSPRNPRPLPKPGIMLRSVRLGEKTYPKPMSSKLALQISHQK